MACIRKATISCYIFLLISIAFSQVEAYSEVCSSDSDCSYSRCCNSHGKCAKECSLAGWMIGVIVLSVIVVIAITIGLIIFCCSKTGSTRSGRILQPGTTVVVLSPQQYTEQQGQQMYYQPYPNQPPPPYLAHSPAYVCRPEIIGSHIAMTPQTQLK